MESTLNEDCSRLERLAIAIASTVRFPVVDPVDQGEMSHPGQMLRELR